MAAVPEAPTITDGITPSSKWNEFRDAIRFLENPPLAELRQSVAQPLPHATWTAITLDLEDEDTDVDGIGGHSTSVNTSRFTARYPGWYDLGGGVSVVVSGAGVRGAKFQVVGIDVNGSQALFPTQASFSNIITAHKKQVYLGVGDYVELLGYQSSGGALNTSVSPAVEQSHMSVRWVSL